MTAGALRLYPIHRVGCNLLGAPAVTPLKPFAMRHYYLPLLLLGSLTAGTLFLGNSGGAAQVQKADRTGSPAGFGTCQNCHDNNAFGPSLDLKLLAQGQPVTSYVPGESYTLRVIVKANQNASTFGFQAVALLPGSNAQAGSFKDAPSGVAVRTLNNRQYPEHSFPSLKDTFQLTWVAPAAGTGNVRIYSSGIAANGNGNDGGDGAAAANILLTEQAPSSTDGTAAAPAPEFRLQDGQLSLADMQGPGVLSLYDLQGRLLASARIDAGSAVRMPLPAFRQGIAVASFETASQRFASKVFLP